MNMDHTVSQNLTALLAGVVCHALYFRMGEHHMYAVVYLRAFILASLLSIIYLIYQGQTLQDASYVYINTTGSWLLGIYTSLTFYRLALHPLRKFPGPWQARISTLLMSMKFSKLDGYIVLDELHKKYGPYVRIGTNDLSITDPDIMDLIYNPTSRFTKADWYDSALPHESMHSTRDKGLHKQRRRVWAQAFSDQALRDYEVTVQNFNHQLVARIGVSEESIDVTTLFNLYSFDVMGQLAFGKNYAMVERGQRPAALDLLVEGMKPTGFKFPTWFFRILLSIPGLASGYYKFLNFCSDELRLRLANGSQSTHRDITSWLEEKYMNPTTAGSDPMFQGDARLIIVAGSDTTSAALTFLFYHLARDIIQQEKLREELRPLTTDPLWSDKDIKHAKHLNGVINETLRLHPPVPSGIPRKTPSEGVRVGEIVVPGNVTIITPQYPMGRDEGIYEHASTFVPERWYSRLEMVKHKDAFAPFSSGPYNCIGKNLARLELRTLTTQLILKYQVTFAPGEDGTRLLRETKDHFSVSPGRLDLVFTPILT